MDKVERLIGWRMRSPNFDGHLVPGNWLKVNLSLHSLCSAHTSVWQKITMSFLRVSLPSLLSLLFIFSSVTVVNAKEGFYKCTDVNGKTAYQQRPCSSATKQETVTIRGKSAAIAQLPELSSNAQLFGNSEYTADKDEPVLANQMVFLAKLSQVLATLHPLKFSIVEYYSMNGEWPKSFKELGLEEKSLSSLYIVQVSIVKNGVFLAQLSSEFGAGKKVALVPIPVMGGTSMEWSCFANFPASSMIMTAAKTTLCKSRVIF